MRSTVQTRHDPHAHSGDDGPTQLFQRNQPGHGERCTICPFRPVGTDRAAGTYPPRPILPFPATDAAPPARRNQRTLISPANSAPTALPRPALLTDLRGSGTLILPDALRSSGPDAATIEQAHTPHPLDTRRGMTGMTSMTSMTGTTRLPGRAARDPNFDELASPDITVLQPVAPTLHPVRPVRPRRPARLVSARFYLALNIILGLSITAGLILLAIREAPSAAPGAAASE